MRPLASRKWIHIGGDLEASYDGFKYVDIRGTNNSPTRIFISEEAVRRVLALFHESQLVIELPSE